MNDSFGRTIEYLRVSVTDRCDLRCTYCMPAEGISPREHDEILSYEEILRVVSLLSRLGIKKVRLTGGEPLVRRNLASLVAGLKDIPGIEKVALTTNGVLLAEQLPALVSAGLDGVNISLDTLDEDIFRMITRREGVEKVLQSIEAARAYPELKVKINCVPMPINESQIIPMCERFLADPRLDLRFIELMPIGLGKDAAGLSEAQLLEKIEARFGALTPLSHSPTDGPCKYFSVAGLPGRLGFISAVSDCFCATCNRVRLTSTGFLKTCLQFDRGAELRPLLQGSDEELLDAMRRAILEKPERHAFSKADIDHCEKHTMSQIGG